MRGRRATRKVHKVVVVDEGNDSVRELALEDLLGLLLGNVLRRHGQDVGTHITVENEVALGREIVADADGERALKERLMKSCQKGSATRGEASNERNRDNSI